MPFESFPMGLKYASLQPLPLDALFGVDTDPRVPADIWRSSTEGSQNRSMLL
jgi:hypothetical protein